MAIQAVRWRTQATIAWQAGAKVSESLLKGMIYRELYLRLTGQPTVSGVNNTQAKTLRGDEWALIEKIEVKANGTDTIRSFSGNVLWWLNFFLYSLAPKTTETLGDGSTANPSIDSMLVLPFLMPNSIQPEDTVIDSSRVQSLTIEITWASSHTALNASASGFTTDPAMQICSLESFFPNGGSITPANWRIYEIIENVTSANPKQQVKLNTGPIYRGFLINAVSDAVDVSTIISNIKLLSGSTVIFDLPGEVVKQITRLKMGTGAGQFGGQVYNDLRIGDTNNVEGWYFIDFATLGKMSEAIDSLGLSELILEFNVAHPGTTDKVYIYPLEIIPVRGGKAG